MCAWESPSEIVTGVKRISLAKLTGTFKGIGLTWASGTPAQNAGTLTKQRIKLIQPRIENEFTFFFALYEESVGESGM